MTQEMDATLTTLCNCELSSSNLFNKSVTCEPNDGVMTFQMSFAFANFDGSLTASSLAVEAEQWIEGVRNVSGTLFIVQAASFSNITTPSSTTTTATTPNEQVRILFTHT